MLASEDKGELERELQAWCDRLERFELKHNVKKAEYLTTDVTESSSIEVNGIELPRTAVFKYLGSAVVSDGKLMVEVNSRVSVAWSKWRLLTGVLSDKKIPEHFQTKIYGAVARAVAMCGAECWPATKEVETRLSVMETKMLRWTTGVTRMDLIRNDVIRQKLGVAPRADKMRDGTVSVWKGRQRPQDYCEPFCVQLSTKIDVGFVGGESFGVFAFSEESLEKPKVRHYFPKHRLNLQVACRIGPPINRKLDIGTTTPRTARIKYPGD
ncbi:unnamed protein product [Heligmosomoides polygyrus]|uniref:Reverse transcriptase domain-containing protein n=1 Tax=Heligmosomoides polygyrus TaxID=6339 RepID=A0A183FHR9_HELPZ|nr:unnamed protein product [Heligmosomoides polygyrus]